MKLLTQKLIGKVLQSFIFIVLASSCVSSAMNEQEILGEQESTPEQAKVPVFLQQLSNGLKENKMEKIAGSLEQLLQKIPSSMKQGNQREGFYHSLAHTILRFTNNQVSSDIPTGSGEADTFIQTKDGKNIYIFEFKINSTKKAGTQKKGIINALRQIFDRDYYKEHHQDGIPMTLAGISFYSPETKKIQGDNFKELTCGALHLRTEPTTLRAYPFSEPTESLGTHDNPEDFCTKENWNKFHVTGTEKSPDQADVFYENIQAYHNNLKNIYYGLENRNIPLVVKNIECILHAIPWSLRQFNREYYQAIIYTALLSTGLEITMHKNCITVQTEDHCFNFICSFSNSDNIYAIQKEMRNILAKKCKVNQHAAQSLSMIMLNVNQIPVHEKTGSKSKIELISYGLILQNNSVFALDGTKVCSINNINAHELEKSKALLLKSPRTPFTQKEDCKRKLPESPYQPCKSSKTRLEEKMSLPELSEQK